MGEKGERTKDQICKEAFQLFAQRGYTAVSMQDICTKCGLSKGGLYRHYESRKQLFMDLLERAQNNEDDREALFYQMSVPTPVILDAFLEHIRLELNPQLPRINLAIYEFCSAYKEEIGGISGGAVSPRQGIAAAAFSVWHGAAGMQGGKPAGSRGQHSASD